jgi:hypothetical protein
MLFKNKIDRLIKKQEKMIVAKQNVKENVNYKNQILGNKRDKIENQILVNRKRADDKIEELERKIAKNIKLVEAEKEYHNNIESKRNDFFEVKGNKK